MSTVSEDAEVKQREKNLEFKKMVADRYHEEEKTRLLLYRPCSNEPSLHFSSELPRSTTEMKATNELRDENSSSLSFSSAESLLAISTLVSDSKGPSKKPAGSRTQAVPITSGSRPVLFRVKSYLLTKVAESSIGRQAIPYVIGTEGEKILGLLETCVELQEGKLQAEKLMTYIIRFSVTCRLLHEERYLSQKDVIHLSAPVTTFILNLFESFQAVRDNDPQNLDVEVLARQGALVRNRLLDVLRPHLPVMDLAKVTWVMGLLTGQSFLEALFTSPSLAFQREQILANLTVLTEPLQADREGCGRCKYSRCERLELMLEPPELFSPNFRRLGYCTKHHFKTYQNINDHPSPQHFITADPTCDAYFAFMARALPPFYQEFYRATGNYQVEIFCGISFYFYRCQS
jgi:hypothetical protein